MEYTDVYNPYDWDIQNHVLIKFKGLTDGHIEIPSTVRTIGKRAFTPVYSHITEARGEVIIPDTVTRIEDEAFYNCVNLVGISIPTSVTSIGTNAFSGCANLEEIIIPKSVTSYESAVFFGCSSLKELVVSGSVKTIDRAAFCSCTSLRNVKLEDGVEFIGDDAFSDTSLQTLEIPPSVKHIGCCAFNRCKHLTNIKVNKKNNAYKSIDGSLYSIDGKTLIRARRDWDSDNAFPEELTTIGCYSFEGCTGIRNLKLPDGVTEVCDCAFFGCRYLESTEIPSSVRAIGEDAFSFCGSLESVIFRNTDDWVFNKGKDKCVAVKDKVLRNPTAAKDFLVRKGGKSGMKRNP